MQFSWTFLFGSSIGSLTAFGLMGRWGMGIEAAVLTMIFGALCICWNSRKRLTAGRVIAISAEGITPPPPAKIVKVEVVYDNGQFERFEAPATPAPDWYSNQALTETK
jgi:hypothetical protein